MKYFHVNVFSSTPLAGNGLTAVFPDRPLEHDQMLAITQEFRQFETIFIFPQNKTGEFPARIFTVEEELDFAGHPIIGAGAIVHQCFFNNLIETPVSFLIDGRTVTTHSAKRGSHYHVSMNQGIPEFINTIPDFHYPEIASALNLSPKDISTDLPVETVSTGLPYLIVPINSNIETASINHDDFKQFLSRFGAKFVYVFDTNTIECRTWDNSGHVEDVATGSAAGPLSAYLVKHGLFKKDESILIRQGTFVNRPSIIQGIYHSKSGDIHISGDVAFFGKGTLCI